MTLADTPPPPPAAAAEVVVAHSDHSTVAASLDLPLVVRKAGRWEELVVRRALFVTASLAQTRSADGPSDGRADRYRWTLTGYLQRQYCVRSLTGLFACTEPQTTRLADAAQGEAALVAAGEFPLAVAAEEALAADLKARAAAVFDEDRQAVVDPWLKAAGVTLPRAAPPRRGGRPATAAPAAAAGSAD